MHNSIIMMQTYSKSKCLLFFISSIFLLQALVKGSGEDERKVYIVYMGELPETNTNLMDDHHKLLMDAIGDKEMAIQSKVYTYGRSLNGFAAKLLPHEADKISKNENVVSVFPSTKRELLTTGSWDFLGMPITLQRNEAVESDIIIGLLDSGIYIPSKSFSDAGYGPPPKKWKGVCQTGNNFTGCNNKVIGAQYFDKSGVAPSDQLSPADYEGHGTHTSSIAAGVPVYHANYNGKAEGTARGGVPHARIAMYKTCWPDQFCLDEDILAGFDAAIADGVDILSVSLGGKSLDYVSDVIAIGSFHAIRRGILVSCAGGNAGLLFSRVSNVAPWIMTVAASTTDRTLEPPNDQFTNGKKLHGNGSLLLRTTKPIYAPVIADFSSKGPETISHKILKPDLAAPGKDILAAYTELTDFKRREYYIMSGTSMACPHAASAAAYIKSFHPDWSPAALRSALMTTAKPMRVPVEGAELATGAGNIDPVAALDPGLVYDMDSDSYVSFLCQLGYNDTLIGLMSGNKTAKCSDYPPHSGHDGLNYPSIHYQLKRQNDTDISAVFERKLKNVGEGNKRYRARVTSPPGISIQVEPDTLYFSEAMTQASFKVTLKGKFQEEKQWYLSGAIQWTDSTHIVKTPILVYRPRPKTYQHE